MSENYKNHGVANVIYPIAKPLAEKLGLEIWDIKLVKEGPNKYLRIFIDKDDGITLDDCENMSRALDEPLDILDPIPDSYFLEVCSPGIERELSEDRHLKKYLNFKVKVRLIRANENGQKEIMGTLKCFDKGTLTLEHVLNNSENTDYKSKIIIERKNISHINLEDNNIK